MIKHIILWLCVGGGVTACTQEITPAVNVPVSVPKTLDSMSTKNYTSGKKLIAMGSFKMRFIKPLELLKFMLIQRRRVTH
jgi:hypothetical protein